MSLINLPDEILALVLQHLDAPSTLALNKTAKAFLAVTNEPLIWRGFCISDFRYWDDKPAFHTWCEHADAIQWKQLYIARQNNALRTTQCLQSLVDRPCVPVSRIDEISEGGYQSKDALSRAFRSAHETTYDLAQRYWSHTALGHLQRKVAFEEWANILANPDKKNAIERALAALDMFILDDHEVGDIDDIFDRLNSYVVSVRRACPDIDDQMPIQRAVTVAEHLRKQGWVGKDKDRAYHSLDHLFLGVALFSDHHSSLPLVSAVIYSYVCRHFDLDARAINFPMHVLVLVRPPSGFDVEGKPLPADHDASVVSNLTQLLMDPYNTSLPAARRELEQQVSLMIPGIASGTRHAFFAPASARDLLIRTADNIHNSLHDNTVQPDQYKINPQAALYASFAIHVLFSNDPTLLRTHLTEVTQQFYHYFHCDLSTVRRFVLPSTVTLPDHPDFERLITQLAATESETPPVKIRLSDQESPQYRVGQVFRHRRRNYLAVIYGWDHHCKMSPQWIQMNRVDALPRGRNQPFYNVYVADDESTRYVADENVVLLGPTSEGGSGELMTQANLDAFGLEVGKWFRRFDWERGRFESNIRGEYPED